MKNYAVNVIVPVYNVEEYIDEFASSILEQTFDDYNVIFVYDQSTDRTWEKISDLQARYGDKVAIIRNTFKDGLGAARDVALDSGLCTADYIMFVDGDDKFEANFIESLYREAIASDADIVACGFDRFDSDTGGIYSVEMNSWDKPCISDLWQNDDVVFVNPAVWNKIYKADLIRDFRFTNIKRAEDTFYFARLLPRIRKIRLVNDVYCHYRVRRGSLSFSISERNYDEFLENFRKVRDEYVAAGKSEYLPLLEMIVFIHAGISFTYRLCAQEKQMSRFIRKTKTYLDREFPGWRQNRYLGLTHSFRSHGLRGMGLWGCRLLYKMNLFGLFVIAYNFMINVLKRDIKW